MISVFSVIVMILIKLVMVILLGPLIFFRWLVKVATGLATIICWIAAAVVAVVWISGFFSDSGSPIYRNIMMILIFLILVATPVLFGALVIFMDWLELKLYNVLRLPLTCFAFFIFSKQRRMKKDGEKEKEAKAEKEEANRDGDKDENKGGNKDGNKDDDLHKLFAGVASESELHKRYKDLLKIYHPDNQTGDTAMSQKIQEVYEKLLKSGEFK
jgi:Ca2+/Na+ antiporter